MSTTFVPQCSARGCNAACVKRVGEFSKRCDGTNCPVPGGRKACKNKYVTGCQNSAYRNVDYCGNSCRFKKGLHPSRCCTRQGCLKATRGIQFQSCDDCRGSTTSPSTSQTTREGFPIKRGCVMYPTMVAFWNHDDCPLMQWSNHGFNYDGERFPTTEHFMMASKASILGDYNARRRIMQASSPNQAKDIARTIDYSKGDLWESQREEIVYMGNLLKFQQNHEIGSFLQSTRPKSLVEGSPHDRVWGCGIDYRDSNIQTSCHGRNLLGKILERVRRDPNYIIP